MIPVRTTIAAALLMAGLGGNAVGKLPPPTAEEAAAAAAAKEKAKEAAEQAQAERMKVIDRIAEQYIARMKAKGVEVHPTPVDGSKTDAAVTPAPGRTPAESDSGEAPERKGGPPSTEDATHADAGKDSNKK